MWKPKRDQFNITRYDFKMECNGKCRNIGIVESNNDGDVDLYGREDAIPDLNNDIDNFDSHHACVSCKCRSHKIGTYNDRCSILQTSGNNFFFTVHIFDAISDLTVTVTCDNLSNVKCIGDQCGRDTGTLSK